MLWRSGLLFVLLAGIVLRADVVDLKNGDRYVGKVVSVSGDTVVLESEVLGTLQLPRKAIAHVAFGTNAVASTGTAPAAPTSASTNRSNAGTAVSETNRDLSAAFRSLGANTNFIRQVRENMLRGNSEAGAKYDELVNGLLSGQINLDDLRREARSSAEQLQSLKQGLGPEAGGSLDMYLEVLDRFLQETAETSARTSSVPLPPQHTGSVGSRK